MFLPNLSGEMTAPISKSKFPGNQPEGSNSYTGGQDYIQRNFDKLEE